MRKATTSDTIEFEVETSKASSEVKENKGFDGKEMVLYPSAKTKIRLAMIDMGETADFILNDKNYKDNVNKTVFTVNSLVEPFNGARKVKSGRRLIQKTADTDAVVNGKTIAKKGQIFSFYDKFAKCIFTDLNKEWELSGDKNKYRVSGAETYFLAYIFDITDIEKLEKKEVNQVALVGFNIMDLYSASAKGIGVGEFLQNLLSEDEDGEIMGLTYSLTYTAGSLEKSKKEMGKTEQAVIDELRLRKDELMEEYKHLMPIEYKVLEEAVKNGDYELSTPNSKPTANGSKVSFGSNMEDDDLPF